MFEKGLTNKTLKQFDWRYVEDDDINYVKIIKSNLRTIKKEINLLGNELLGGAIAGQLWDEGLKSSEYFLYLGFDETFSNNISIYNRFIKAYAYYLFQKKNEWNYVFLEETVLDRLRFLRNCEMYEIYCYLIGENEKLNICTNEHERIIKIELDSGNDKIVDAIITNMDLIDDLLLAIESQDHNEIIGKLNYFTLENMQKIIGINFVDDFDPFDEFKPNKNTHRQ